jgi:iron complex outermembrane recepter protein
MLLTIPGVRAADSDEANTDLPTVTVIGATPVPGAQIDADKVPSNVESVRAADLTRDGSASLATALNGRLGSVNLNDTLADPFQPDVFYRGFDASPVLGTPQGLAVYQNGVRINEAFGDAVNWDLIPDIAINGVDIVSANPVYGLNALGGAATLSMKDGFSYQGGELELAGGSYRQHTASAQVGGNDGQFGVYAGGRILDQQGWRFFAHDRIRQFYAAVSARLDPLSLDLTYTHADNGLYGPGAAPVQSLALDPRQVFTGPQANLNRLDFPTLSASYSVSQDLSVQAVAYFRDFRESVANGNTTNFAACTTTSGTGLLCQDDGTTPVVNAAGQPLPDISNGGTVLIGEDDFENIHSRGAGGSLQLTGRQPLAGHDNQFSAGATVDSAHIDFSSGAQIGVLDANLVVQPSDLLVSTPEGTDFDATPTILKATNRYYGFFFTDTFDVSPKLSLTASGRYNIADVDLYDQRGTALDGLNHYTHFNPAAGLTYKLSPLVTAYGSYATTNRAPTASEIECSDPLLPCLLPANLAGDPPGLRQVVARTYEAGLRGRLDVQTADRGHLTWNLGAFRTDLTDDIYAISSTLSTGFFQNVGSTRRQGGQAEMAYADDRLAIYLDYSYTDATFQSAFELNSPSNPSQDANGNIQVRPGDRLPGIPRHRIKAGADYNILPQWTIGATLVYTSSQFYKGDESNQNAPLPGYAVMNLHSAVRLWRQSELFISVVNVFDRRYSTYGVYSDPTGVGAPGIPANAASNDPGVDNRFQNPAAPRTIFGGLRMRF